MEVAATLWGTQTLKSGKGRKGSWRLLSLQTGSQPSLTIRIQRRATAILKIKDERKTYPYETNTKQEN